MRAVGLVLVTLSVAALAGSAPLQAQHRSTNLLSAEEIENAKTSISTAYDAVQMLRPRWLQKHKPLPEGPPDVLRDTIPIRIYLDDHSMGGLDFLKTVAVAMVQEMRWLSANEAASRFGSTDGLAAIVVTLKRGG